MALSGKNLLVNAVAGLALLMQSCWPYSVHYANTSTPPLPSPVGVGAYRIIERSVGKRDLNTLSEKQQIYRLKVCTRVLYTDTLPANTRIDMASGCIRHGYTSM